MRGMRGKMRVNEIENENTVEESLELVLKVYSSSSSRGL
jgi:hypothetical protein